MVDEQVLLSVENLAVDFTTYDGTARVLNGVNLTLNKGDVLGLVGESGCGKTVTSLVITGLIGNPPAKVISGKAIYEGRDLLTLTKDEMSLVRSKEIAMVFQDPSSNLNPLITIGQQVTDAILCRQGNRSALSFTFLGSVLPGLKKEREKAREKGIELLQKVGIQNPGSLFSSFPFQFSGGMRQRTLIAMALGGDPKLLIADEPTTDLDVSIQSQVLQVVRDLVNEMGLSVLWITHDLGVVARLCNRVAVMYAGNIVEIGAVECVFKDPKHPYTIGLMDSSPRIKMDQKKLSTIPGFVPSLYEPPAGCRFHTRCPHVMEQCKEGEFPRTIQISDNHSTACHLFDRETIAK